MARSTALDDRRAVALAFSMKRARISLSALPFWLDEAAVPTAIVLRITSAEE